MRRVLSAALPSPEHRVRFSSSDGAGVLSWVTITPCQSVSAAWLRKLDRACSLGRPWSEYDVLEELLSLPSAESDGQDDGARTRVVVTLHGAGPAVILLELRGARWNSDLGRRATQRLLAWCGRGVADSMIAADGSDLQGVALRLGRHGVDGVSLVKAGPVTLDRIPPEALDPTNRDDLASLVASASAGGDGAPRVLSWSVTLPERPRGRCAVGVELEGVAPLDGLLHGARSHVVGYRLCQDLLARAPHRLEIVLRPAAAPTVTVEGRLHWPSPHSAVGVWRSSGLASRSGIRHAARRAANHLLDAQSPGGGWWDLPVSAGASGAWLTAVVGLALHAADTAGIAASSRVRAAMSVAVAYLQIAELPNGGWGWNEALDADCDSTAHAVLFLTLRGGAKARSIAALRDFQTSDGRFLTYRDAPAGHSWGRLHHDVHPAAVHALAAACGRTDPAVLAGLPHVRAGRETQPPWPAFWWSTSGYGAYVALRCLEQLGELGSLAADDRRRLLRHLAENEIDPLVIALACAVATRTAARVQPLVERLLHAQRPDGGWSARPALRVVVPHVDEPWRPELAAVAGPLYPELRGLFTTAIALEALVLVSR